MGNAFFVVWRESLGAFLIDDVTKAGKLLADFSGYRARPALTTLLAWAAYWTVVFIGWRKSGRG